MTGVPKICGAGIGLRPVHVPAFLDTKPDLGWCEVITDNYLAAAENDLAMLDRVRADYPISLHGVGMSLGSADPLDSDYLSRVKILIERFQPTLVSEHLCWTSIGGHHLHDLLPLPYTEEVVRHLCNKIDEVQSFFGRQLLVENVSSYLTYRESTLSEWDFLQAISSRTGCGVLLDVSNIIVSTTNHKLCAADYLRSMTELPIQELHVGGFQERENYLLDTHDGPIDDRTWSLYRAVLEIIGPKPTLIEWDNDLPTLDKIVTEARLAGEMLEQYATLAA